MLAIDNWNGMRLSCAYSLHALCVPRVHVEIEVVTQHRNALATKISSRQPTDSVITTHTIPPCLSALRIFTRLQVRKHVATTMALGDGDVELQLTSQAFSFFVGPMATTSAPAQTSPNPLLS